jgi:hypothetical protein
MKIKATFNKENISDVLEINGNDLTVNGLIMPLDNLPKYPTEENADIQVFLEANPAYTDQNGEDILQLKVAMNRNFLFMNNNYLIFHDKNMNGEFDQAELEDFVNCYNLENDDRIEEHRQYYIEFCLQSVSEGNKGKAREFYNMRTPGTLRANYTRTLKQFIADNELTDVFKTEVMAGYNAWMGKVKTCMEMK